MRLSELLPRRKSRRPVRLLILGRGSVATSAKKRRRTEMNGGAHYRRRYHELQNRAWFYGITATMFGVGTIATWFLYPWLTVSSTLVLLLSCHATGRYFQEFHEWRTHSNPWRARKEREESTTSWGRVRNTISDLSLLGMVACAIAGIVLVVIY